MLLAERQAASLDLHNGDRMTREEFHRIYERAPEELKAELIGGVVYMASPLKERHASYHLALGTLFGTYIGRTPGVTGGDNATVMLGDESEPQPDLYLRVLRECGGQSGRSDDGYVTGAPELLAEIAESSRSLDLHAKRDDYRRYGVREYLVVNLRDGQLHWFDFAADEQLQPDSDGIARLRTMPGLWIDVAALFAQDLPRAVAALQSGLGSPEHAEFVKKLAAAKGA